MSNYDARRSTVLEPVTRPSRNYRHECPPLDDEVTRVAANYIATVTRLRDGSIVIDTDSLRAAQLACTRLGAIPGDGRIYTLIDDRPFEIVTVGAPLLSDGCLLGGTTGLFLRAYRLVEKSGQERWLLRPSLVLVATETVLRSPTAYPDALISVGRSVRGSYRLKPWRWLTEGKNKNHPGTIVRVRP